MKNKDLAIKESQEYVNENPEHFQSILNEEPNPCQYFEDKINYDIEQAEEGYAGFLETVIELRAIKEFFDKQLKKIKEFEDKYYSILEQESSEIGGELKGVKFEFRNGGKVFSFDNIKEIREKEDELKSLKEKYKSAWENKQKGLLAVTEDGEELELPTISYRKSSMIVKLPKA